MDCRSPAPHCPAQRHPSARCHGASMGARRTRMSSRGGLFAWMSKSAERPRAEDVHHRVRYLSHPLSPTRLAPADEEVGFARCMGRLAPLVRRDGTHEHLGALPSPRASRKSRPRAPLASVTRRQTAAGDTHAPCSLSPTTFPGGGRRRRPRPRPWRGRSTSSSAARRHATAPSQHDKTKKALGRIFSKLRAQRVHRCGRKQRPFGVRKLYTR